MFFLPSFILLPSLFTFRTNSTHTSRRRYAFRSPEKVALQEIGPRFTLKLRSLRKGIPAVQRFGDAPKPLTFEADSKEADEEEGTLEGEREEGSAPQTEGTETEAVSAPSGPPQPVIPPATDEYLWAWKVRTLFCLR